MKRQKRQTNGKVAKLVANGNSHSEGGMKRKRRKSGTTSGSLCSVCESSNPEIACGGVCQRQFHSSCIEGGPNFVCSECSSGKHPCFVCKVVEVDLKQCSVDSCGKFYHSECLKKLRVADKDPFVCPLHTCLTCTSNQKVSAAVKCNLVCCIRCPVAYHSRQECMAAGCKVLSNSFILCPGHFGPVNGNLFESVANIPWCSVCSESGKLLHCSCCPASYHEHCLSGEVTLVGNVCRDCTLRKYPLTGSIVWAKIGPFCWWPARIMAPEDVPRNLQKQICAGEFPIQYFSTKQYFWTYKGRVHPYFCVQDDSSTKSSMVSLDWEASYKSSIEEANAAFDEWVESSSLNNKSKPQYKHIRCNHPIGEVQIHTTDVLKLPRCSCDPLSENPCSDSSECLNRTVLVECHPSVCPAGERCQNQLFQKRIYPKLSVFKTEKRGWALKTLEDIKKGRFVIEYIGDLIDEKECNRRLAEKGKNNDSDFYFLTIDKDRIIDAGPKGNLSRFLNHSCSPNCETQKWQVNGVTRIGIFAKEDITAGTELTFDYQMESMDHYKLKCLCGAKNCRGVIGIKTQHALSQTQQKKTKNNQLRYSVKKCCFLCNKPSNLIRCDFKGCTKLYHMKCLGRNEIPTSRWHCSWHHCNTCGRLSKHMCTKCTNSYCDKHKTAENMVLVSEQMFCPKHVEM